MCHTQIYTFIPSTTHSLPFSMPYILHTYMCMCTREHQFTACLSSVPKEDRPFKILPTAELLMHCWLALEKHTLSPVGSLHLKAQPRSKGLVNPSFALTR